MKKKVLKMLLLIFYSQLNTVIFFVDLNIQRVNLKNLKKFAFIKY